MELESAALAIFSGSVDIKITDADGRTIRDTKQERIDKTKDLSELVAKYKPGDRLLRAMLQSYSVSTADQNNELVHLYEIREALSLAFHGEDNARRALTIPRVQWSRLGQLCNDEPLRQGRHRGRGIGTLRDATEGELSETR